MTPSGAVVTRLAAQPPILAERVRASVLAWRRDAPWFDSTRLGPGPHSHPGATELFVVLKGAFELAVGGERMVMRERDVFLIPPDAVHEPLGTAGTDLALASIVSPNRGLRFMTSDFPPSAYERPACRGYAGAGEVPSNRQLHGDVFILGEGEELGWEGRPDVDRVLLVLAGEVELWQPPLHGRLPAGCLTFVPARTVHCLGGIGAAPALVLAVWATGLDADETEEAP